METAYATFRTRVRTYHENRASLGIAANLMLAAGWAVATGLLAQARLPLPFTPVPVTLQVFGVVFGVALLGPAYGGASQLIYVLVGIIGIPWYAGYTGGITQILGPTGGYLVAFPVAAWLMGFMLARGRVTMLRYQLASYAGLVVIYALGMTWLAVVLHVGLAKAFLLGVAPFILVDAIKISIAASIARTFAWD